MNGESDLIGIPVVLGAILSVLAIFAAYFLIGVLAGTIVLFAVLIFAGFLLIRVIGRNEVE